MKISAKGRAALTAMLVLAVHEPKRLSVKAIAKKQNLSSRYLEQIFSELKKHQLIEGLKGPQGGYTIIKCPDTIALIDIIRAVEGHHTFALEDQGDLIDELVQNVLHGLEENIEAYLSERSLEDLVKDYKKNTHEGYMYFI
jgi:Rrf2 family protein